jgi:hypothetical protein
VIGEAEIAGVFVPRLLIVALFSLVMTFFVKLALRKAGAYRFIWHAALFDLALFVVLCSLVAMATAGITPYGDY